MLLARLVFLTLVVIALVAVILFILLRPLFAKASKRLNEIDAEECQQQAHRQQAEEELKSDFPFLYGTAESRAEAKDLNEDKNQG